MAVRNVVSVFKYHDMKAYEGVDAKLHTAFTSPAGESEKSGCRIDRFTPCKHWQACG